VAKLAGVEEPTKRTVKNELEKRLPAIRKRLQILPDVSRRGNYADLHNQLIWFEIDVRSLRDDLRSIQTQEELL
jgi:hypothetical protein